MWLYLDGSVEIASSPFSEILEWRSSGFDPSHWLLSGGFTLLGTKFCIATARDFEVRKFLNSPTDEIWGPQIANLSFFWKCYERSSLMTSFWSRFNLELGDLWTVSISHSEIIKSFYYFISEKFNTRDYLQIPRATRNPSDATKVPGGNGCYRWHTDGQNAFRRAIRNVNFPESQQHKVSSAVFEELRQREDTKPLTFIATFRHWTNVSTVYRGHKSSKKIRNLCHRLVWGTQKLRLRAYRNDTAHEPQQRTDGQMNGQQDCQHGFDISSVMVSTSWTRSPYTNVHGFTLSVHVNIKHRWRAWSMFSIKYDYTRYQIGIGGGHIPWS